MSVDCVTLGAEGSLKPLLHERNLLFEIIGRRRFWRIFGERWGHWIVWVMAPLGAWRRLRIVFARRGHRSGVPEACVLRNPIWLCIVPVLRFSVPFHEGDKLRQEIVGRWNLW